ncbi:MAG: hypothetical protein R3F62_13530 [Planctomycetota bacterium]
MRCPGPRRACLGCAARRARATPDETLETTYARLSRGLVAQALAIVGDPSLAEDLVH